MSACLTLSSQFSSNQVVRMWMKIPAISRWRPLEKLRWKEVVSNSSRPFATAPLSKVKLGVQGVCFELGQKKHGVSKAPAVLRETQFIECFRQVVKLDVKDYGDVAMDKGQHTPNPAQPRPLPNRESHSFIKTSLVDPVPPLNVPEVAEASRIIAKGTAEILKDGRIPLTLGGDHSISIGTVAAVATHFRDIGLLWIDAHADINTPHTTASGSLHGMVLAMLIREMKPYCLQLPGFFWLNTCIPANRVVYLGLRDVEPYEKSFLEKLGIRAYSMASVDQKGVNAVIEAALDYLTHGNPQRAIHVSFDVDALDDLEIPCTGTTVPGGLTLREGMHIMETIYANVNLVSMDVVEFNPLIGSELEVIRSTKAIKELIFSSFGYDRQGLAVADEQGNPIVPTPPSQEFEV